jgi:type II secretory pathway component PulF
VVLPQITELLASLNQPLPFYTRAIIEMARFMKSYWWAVAAALLMVAILIRAVLRTEAGRANFDRLKLRLPVVGRTVRLLAISRFTRTLSTLLARAPPPATR